MGWLFHTTDYGRKAFIEERTTKYNQETETSKWECLAHSVKSNHLWKVIRYTNKSTNEVKTFVALDLIAKERNGGWGYKDMDESAGPCHYDCPLKFLAMSDEPTEEQKWAFEWRKKVRELHANKKKVVKKEIGGIYKVIPDAKVNNCIVDSVQILEKLNAKCYACKAFAENGQVIAYRVRITSQFFA